MMERIATLLKTEWIRMPKTVDEPVLRRVAREIARTEGTCRVVLHFAETSHIDFRALRRFGGRVGKQDKSIYPIYLAGLSAYCELIFCYAFGAEHWELFRDVEDAGEPAAEMPTVCRPRIDMGKGWVASGSFANRWGPHLN